MPSGIFVDLREEPGKLPPLSIHSIAVAEIIDSIAGVLANAGASREALFTAYTEEFLMWDLPSTYGLVGGVHQNLQLPRNKLTLKDVFDAQDYARAAIPRWGLNATVRKRITEYLGLAANHPLMFSTTEPSLDNSHLFCVELALALGAFVSTLVIQGGNIHRKIKVHNDNGLFIGVHSVRDPKANIPWLLQSINSSKGMAIYPGFDSIDRCKVWASSNLFSEDLKQVDRGLSLLKLCQNPKVVQKLEDAMSNLDHYKVEVQTEFQHILFQEEILESIRVVWVEGAQEAEKAFRELYEYISPTYLDHNQFERMFKKGLLSKKKLDAKDIDAVNRGLQKFTTWFEQMSRKGKVAMRSGG